MRVAADKTSEVHNHTRRIEVEDAPVMPVPHSNFSHRGKEFRPLSVISTWNHGDTPETVSVYGVLLKKDGTEGAVRVNVGYNLLGPDKRQFRATEEAPDWIKELFA